MANETFTATQTTVLTNDVDNDETGVNVPLARSTVPNSPVPELSSHSLPS